MSIPGNCCPQMPSVTAADDVAALVRSGRAVNLPEFSRAKMVKVFYGQNELIAIASRVAGTLFHPKIVLAAESERKVRVGSGVEFGDTLLTSQKGSPKSLCVESRGSFTISAPNASPELPDRHASTFRD